jgi:uncharacterized cofD-like protein
MKNLANKHIVCLGGGIGTSNLLRGLKQYQAELTAVTSMADDGGSSGRLRKAYNVMPPGDIVSCIAALMDDKQGELASLLTYRFPGQDDKNKVLGGHKLGNLIMLAEMQRTGDFYKALEVTKKIFGVTANLLPATDERTHLSATTQDGRRVHTETTLDLALYSKPHGLKQIFIRPKNPKVNKRVIDAILQADVIISGPGDLYTNQLPVLVIPQIKKAILESKAKKMFILNVANKPFETKNFTLKNFVDAITDHLDTFPFDTIIANNNQSFKIPSRYDYNYIKVDKELRETKQSFSLVEGDLVSHNFPIYHDPQKLAEMVVKEI